MIASDNYTALDALLHLSVKTAAYHLYQWKDQKDAPTTLRCRSTSVLPRE